MIVEIRTFGSTRVACITHRGSPECEHKTVAILVNWKIRNKLLAPEKHQHYGLHYDDPFNTPVERHRVDFCLSVGQPVGKNRLGIEEMIIPRQRCAVARDEGSRGNNQDARFLLEQWLPASGENMADYPMIFHYLNVGPGVTPENAITDVYLPLA